MQMMQNSILLLFCIVNKWEMPHCKNRKNIIQEAQIVIYSVQKFTYVISHWQMINDHVLTFNFFHVLNVLTFLFFLSNVFTAQCYASAMLSSCPSLRHKPVYMRRNDVTESMVTIQSPFCGYSTTKCVELNGEALSCYSNKTESVSLRKCPYDHWLTDKAYLSAITARNISRSFTYKMAAEINWHRYGTKLRHCHPMYCIEKTGLIELVLAWRLPSTYIILYYEEIQVPVQK